MNTYKVTEFGIVPGLSTPQTEKLQQLVDRCKAEGGGKILFPAGSYVSGTLVLCSHLTLEYLLPFYSDLFSIFLVPYMLEIQFLL